MAELTIIAGCNGSGKSTFATSFLKEGLTSFDYDKLYLQIYATLQDCEFREEMARNMTSLTFEEEVNYALTHHLDFCYETNFDEHPLYWPDIFKKNGYSINLIFFCLQNQEIAKERIRIRCEFKGHFVDDETIDLKWKAGYKNINTHYSYFDRILFVDNSINNEIYTNLLQIVDNQVFPMSPLPDYFAQRFPNLMKECIFP